MEKHSAGLFVSDGYSDYSIVPHLHATRSFKSLLVVFLCAGLLEHPPLCSMMDLIKSKQRAVMAFGDRAIPERQCHPVNLLFVTTQIRQTGNGFLSACHAISITFWFHVREVTSPMCDVGFHFSSGELEWTELFGKVLKLDTEERGRGMRVNITGYSSHSNSTLLFILSGCPIL